MITTSSILLTILGGLIGIAGTVIAHKLDPKQQLYSKLDALAKKKVDLERQRDEALKTHDNDALTVAGNELIKLHNDQAALLQRLGTLGVK